MECPILMTTVSRMSITICYVYHHYHHHHHHSTLSAHDSNTTCTSSPNSSMITFSNVFYDTEGIPVHTNSCANLPGNWENLT